MCHEIRKYMAALDSDDPLGGPGEVVQIDETLIGGKVTGMGRNNRGNKTIVMGVLENGGELVTRIVPDTRRISLWPEICTFVLPARLSGTS
jgi:transposase